MDWCKGNFAGRPHDLHGKIDGFLFQFSLKPIHPALITIKVPECLSEIYSPQEDLLECLKDDVRGRDPLEAATFFVRTTTALHHTTSGSCGEVTSATVATTPKTQLQPPFGPSVGSLSHP